MKKILLIALVLMLSFNLFAGEKFFYEVIYNSDGIHCHKEIIISEHFPVCISDGVARFYKISSDNKNQALSYIVISLKFLVSIKLINYVKE